MNKGLTLLGSIVLLLAAFLLSLVYIRSGAVSIGDTIKIAGFAIIEYLLISRLKNKYRNFSMALLGLIYFLTIPLALGGLGLITIIIIPKAQSQVLMLMNFGIATLLTPNMLELKK